MCRSKLPLFRYNCRKNCQLASAKLTVFCFILTKNRRILSALQFLLSYFIRISEKKDFAYLPYSWAFLSLRRMKEQRKNRRLFIEGAPKRAFFKSKYRKRLCTRAPRCVFPSTALQKCQSPQSSRLFVLQRGYRYPAKAVPPPNSPS